MKNTKLLLLALPLLLLLSCDPEASRHSSSSFPKGTIIAYYEKAGPIPKGWAICDGTNGTPDLRSKFIMGVGNLGDIGKTGGASEITIDEGDWKGSDWHWGETPWRNGPNPVKGGMKKSILPPYIGILYIMYVGQ